MNRPIRNLRSLMFIGVAYLCVAGIVGAAEVGVKSLSGPPSEFSAHAMPGADDMVVPTNILKPHWRSTTPDKAVQNSSFSTSAGSGFTVLQVTTVYPSFAPLTLTAPNGTTYHFNGSTLTCNGSTCGTYEAKLEIESFSRSSGGAAAISISGGEVTGGSWQLAEQTTPIPGPLPTAGTAPTKAVAEVDSTIGFDDNVVEITVDPDPDPCDDPFPTPQGVTGAEKAALPCPLKNKPRYSLDLLDGAAPVFRVSAYSHGDDHQKVARKLDLTDLRVTVTDAKAQKSSFEKRYTLGEVSGLPSDRDGSTLVPLPPLSPGRYSVRLDIAGVLEGVGPIERTAYYFLPIDPQSHRLTGAVEATAVDHARIEIGLGVQAIGPGFEGKEVTHLFAYGEVWSADGQTPIAWIGGMTQPKVDPLGQNVLPLDFDARWLALAGKQDLEYRLRNVRIQDPDSFVLIHEIPDMPFTIDRLPLAAHQKVTEEVLSDDTLLKGRGDRTISLPDLEDDHLPTKTGLDTGIFLVHGWCSDPTWNDWMFDPTGLVGGTEEYSDPMQSRSHDNFAQRIRNQGDACFNNSFSIVAHSQGGAASVHLLAHYTSGLDLNTAPRRIQSMGTPYGGTTLMDLFIGAGPLAWLIAEIIGDCTPQVNLSTLGAAIWKTSIPNWARDDLFYYRTRHRRPSNFWERLQFWRWKCSIASYILPGHDDGVTAIIQSTISNANDMGITDSQCHTGRMRYADQKDDTNRNDIMNVEGRPDTLPVSPPEFPVTSTGQSEVVLDEDDYAICALGGVLPNNSNGYCYVNQDGDDDTWELFANQASCNFMCLDDSEACSNVSVHEILLTGTSQYVLDDSSYSYCATGGAIPANSNGYCYVNHDGDDDTWELFANQATYCNFMCVRSGCPEISSHREILLTGNSNFTLSNASYRYCAIGGAIPNGACQVDFDGTNWLMSAEGANWCNFMCIYR